MLVAACCFYVGCATAASDESQGMTDQNDHPVEKVVDDIEDDYKEADTRHEDIIDRAFAPLDDTVSDINRDLNDGSSDSAIPQTSD
jgi:isocitrate lyase